MNQTLNKQAFAEGFASVCVTKKANPADLVKQAGVYDFLKGIKPFLYPSQEVLEATIKAPTLKNKMWDLAVNNPLSRALLDNKAVAAGGATVLGGGAYALNEAKKSTPSSIIEEHWPAMLLGLGVPLAGAAGYMAYNKAQAAPPGVPELPKTLPPVAAVEKESMDKKAIDFGIPFYDLVPEKPEGMSMGDKFRTGMSIGIPALMALGGVGAWQLGDYYRNKERSAQNVDNVDQILNMTPEGEFGFTTQPTPEEQKPRIEPTAML
jgi:hypothetical protein